MDKFKTFLKTHKAKLPYLLLLSIVIIVAIIFYKPYYFENDPAKLKPMAKEYLADVKYQDAANIYLKILQKESSSKDEFNAGLALLRDKKYNDALLHIKKAIKLDPQNPYAIAALAEYYFETEDTEKGLREVHKSINIKPSALAYYNLGKFYFRVQSTDNAYNFLTKSVEMDKNQLEIYPYLGEVLTKKGYFVPAFDAYEHYYNEKARINGILWHLSSDEADYIKKQLRSLRDQAGEL